MFGNAGRTGSGGDLELQGSSFARRASRPRRRATVSRSAIALRAFFALGVTGKYIVGNALGMAEDQGSTASANSVAVNFPMVFSRPDSNIVVGTGVGVDVGLACQRAA